MELAAAVYLFGWFPVIIIFIIAIIISEIINTGNIKAETKPIKPSLNPKQIKFRNILFWSFCGFFVLYGVWVSVVISNIK